MGAATVKGNFQLRKTTERGTLPSFGGSKKNSHCDEKDRSGNSQHIGVLGEDKGRQR